MTRRAAKKRRTRSQHSTTHHTSSRNTQHHSSKAAKHHTSRRSRSRRRQLFRAAGNTSRRPPDSSGAAPAAGHTPLSPAQAAPAGSQHRQSSSEAGATHAGQIIPAAQNHAGQPSSAAGQLFQHRRQRQRRQYLSTAGSPSSRRSRYEVRRPKPAGGIMRKPKDRSSPAATQGSTAAKQRQHRQPIPAAVLPAGTRSPPAAISHRQRHRHTFQPAHLPAEAHQHRRQYLTGSGSATGTRSHPSSAHNAREAPAPQHPI